MDGLPGEVLLRQIVHGAPDGTSPSFATSYKHLMGRAASIWQQ